MKAIVALLLALALAAQVRAADSAPSDTGSETTLNILAHRLDGLFSHTLTALQLVASTPEARNGDWPGIKAYLRRLEAELPGAYFFALPDGNYYSVAQDHTRLNLADRPYFSGLIAGKPVMGYPIYSRSTGKKSALVAAPIVVDGKVTGALGASIFLDDLHARVNRELALPPDQTWFVLDAEGNTMLDGDIDYIFMNALSQGSPSLREAAATALKGDRGRLQYDLGGVRHALYRKLPGLDWRLFLVRKEEGEAAAPPRLALSLERFVPELQQALDGIDAAMARQIAHGTMDVGRDEAVRRLLGAILTESPHVVNAARVDHRGFLRQIEPGDYRNFENTDIGGQAHVIAMQQSPRPILSAAFTTVEGFLAVDLARPLGDASGNFAGAVSALIRPERLVAPLLRKSAIAPEHELWIMQTDGMILYDQDREEVGRMLFSDPMYADYASLLELGRKIARTEAGEGSYIFVAPASQEKVIKKAVWRSVRLHGREWRVVLAYRPYEHGPVPESRHTLTRPSSQVPPP